MAAVAPSKRRPNRGGFEENTMALLDASGVRESHHAHDDRLTFLEAVRAASLTGKNGDVPTVKMLDAIFEILKHATSLELAMKSYQLLCDIDKAFPRVSLVSSDEIEVISESWLPFNFGSDTVSREQEISRNMQELIDAERFFILIQEISKALRKEESRKLVLTNSLTISKLTLQDVCNILLFQYLVTVLEHDFVPRSAVYKKTMFWAVIRESLHQTLLASRKLNYKKLIKDCMFITCCFGSGFSSADSAGSFEKKENPSAGNVHDDNISLEIMITELSRILCLTVQRFLTLIMELDVIRKVADIEGFTSRADGLRTPLLEILIDELSYDRDLLYPFLQVIADPKWKLEIILQYFSKYCRASSINTQRSNKAFDADTFANVLKCFSKSNETNARNIGLKMGYEVALILLAHGFQVAITVKGTLAPKATPDVNVGEGSLLQICEDFISAFQVLKKSDKHMVIQSFEKEALFTAATIIQRDSQRCLV